jgi:hypothetical protein
LEHALSLAAFEPTWANERRNYIRCRAIGHSWIDYDSNWTPQFGTPLTLRCERCGMERRDSVNLRGELMHRSYARPDHYHLGRDESKPTRDDFRLMLLAVRGDIEVPVRRKRAAS